MDLCYNGDMTQSVKNKGESLEDHLKPGPENSDPAYLAWKEEKIRKALKQSEDRLKMIPAEKVWEKLGLEH